MSGHDTDRIGEAIRRATESVEAPARLRTAVASPPQRPRRRGLVAAAAGLAVAGLAAIVVVMGGDGEPSTPPHAAAPLPAAAAEALAPTIEPPPARDRRDPRFLDVRAGRLQFPSVPGLREAGWSNAIVAGRRAATVRYVREGEGWFGYTIVAGPPLPVPASARRVTYEGVDAAVMRQDGAAVVAWRRDGQTCLVASWDLGERELLELARGWSGERS